MEDIVGLRFDLKIANWLAHVLDERAPIPVLGDEWEEREAIRMFLQSIEKTILFVALGHGPIS